MSKQSKQHEILRGMIHARFCSSIWFKQMVQDIVYAWCNIKSNERPESSLVCVHILYLANKADPDSDVALAVLRFHKPAFRTWLQVLLKIAATSYISILYKNIFDRNPHVVWPETIVLSIEVYHSMFMNLQHLSKTDI